MAKISTYNLTPPNGTDLLIGTDVTTNNQTKNFSVQSVLNLSAGGGNSVSALVNVELTSDDLLNLNTTPILAVASPGVGKCVIPVDRYLVVKYNYGTTNYVQNNIDRFVLQVRQGTSFPSNNDWLLESTVPSNNIQLDQYLISPINLNGNGIPLLENTGLYIGPKDNLPITQGDGTVSVSFLYRILELP
jgi:hypothetical protein